MICRVWDDVPMTLSASFPVHFVWAICPAMRELEFDKSALMMNFPANFHDRPVGAAPRATLC